MAGCLPSEFEPEEAHSSGVSAARQALSSPGGSASILKMPRDPEDEPQRREVEALRSLLSHTLSAAERKTLLTVLANYRFADPLHQLIFEAIGEMPGKTPDRLREELPACLTRKGFPAVDFEKYLAPPQAPPAEILAWFREPPAGNDK